MLKLRIRRRDKALASALAEIAAVRQSIAALGDDDLLDLADIFAHAAPTPLKTMAATEMLGRNISL